MMISASMAQSIRVGAAGKKSEATSKQTIHKPVVYKQMQNAKPQVAPFSVNKLSQEKIISSKINGDKKIQLVKNSNGTISKRLVSDKVTQKLNRNAAGSIFKNTTVNTFFESFEGWDGITPEWTPDDWSRDNQTELITWDMSDGKLLFSPTDGKYMASTDWLFPFDDDFNPIDVDPRDEMLISPAFTPVTGDNLYFDVNFNAFFMFFDLSTDDFDFDDPFFNIQALVSTDNGANWTTLWDAIEDGGYTEDNIWDYSDNEWFTKKISLDSYIGQSIKIAFRYTDRDGGDDIGLDNIAVRNPNPTALYMRPQGFFNVGMLRDWGSYKGGLDLMLGHAYDETIWRNLSIESDTYSWAFDNPDGSNTIVTRTEKNPDVPYPFGYWFDMPILTASGYGKSSTYQWGVSDKRYFQPGGDTYVDETSILGVGNYDLAYDFWIYTYEDPDDGYIFGTNIDNSIEGVANYFEKPVHRYILEGVWAALGVFSGFPAATEFTMVIHRVVDGYVEDVIATSTCTKADVVALAEYAYTMPFSGFITIDPETGLEVENEYLEIEDAILIEIKGFNNIPGSEICFLNQEFDVDPKNENNAYFFSPDRKLWHYDGATSLILNLEITYSFLFADSDTFIVPEGGGEKDFDITTYFSPEAWWFENELPNWMGLGLKFDDDTWETILKLTAQPLPTSIDSREATIKIVTFGADMSILVKQDRVTNLKPVIDVATSKVVSKNNNFELTYNQGYSAVSIYNIAGQKVASYRLPSSGSFTIPAGNYSKGVYIFGFSGVNGTSAVKTIK